MGNGPGDLRGLLGADLSDTTSCMCGGCVWEWCDHAATRRRPAMTAGRTTGTLHTAATSAMARPRRQLLRRRARLARPTSRTPVLAEAQAGRSSRRARAIVSDQEEGRAAPSATYLDHADLSPVPAHLVRGALRRRRRGAARTSTWSSTVPPLTGVMLRCRSEGIPPTGRCHRLIGERLAPPDSLRAARATGQRGLRRDRPCVSVPSRRRRWVAAAGDNLPHRRDPTCRSGGTGTAAECDGYIQMTADETVCAFDTGTRRARVHL